MYRIGAPEFAAVEAVEQVELVFFALALDVWFLDATARGGVVSGRCEAYHRAVGEGERPLYKAFAKCATAYNYATVVVLHCAGEDFCGRGGILVDNDNKTVDFAERAVGSGGIMALGRVLATSEHNRVAFAEKFVREVHCRLEVAAAVG